MQPNVKMGTKDHKAVVHTSSIMYRKKGGTTIGVKSWDYWLRLDC